MSEGDDRKQGEEPALFQTSAGSSPGGSKAPVILGVLALGAVVAFAAVRLLKKEPAPAPVTSAQLPPPTPVEVPEGATVKIAGGTFQIGSNDGDPDEKPITEVTVSPFALDVTEVTVAAYAKCVEAGKCTEPDKGMYCNWKKPGHERHPINCVDWKQATAYCAFVTKRLPSEEEWEFAASVAMGPQAAPNPGAPGAPLRDKRIYPWKDGAPATQLCWNGDGNDQGRGARQGTCPVASYPAGRSPAGAFDMAGNVWEWTSSAHCPYDHRGCNEEKRVIRGGAWNNLVPRYVRAQDRSTEAQDSRPDNVGFRCAGTAS